MEPLVGLGHVTPCYNHEFVLSFILSILSALRVFFRSRCDTALEVLALDSRWQCSSGNAHGRH